MAELSCMTLTFKLDIENVKVSKVIITHTYVTGPIAVVYQDH